MSENKLNDCVDVYTLGQASQQKKYCKEIAQLKKRLQKAIECLKWYGDKWFYTRTIDHGICQGCSVCDDQGDKARECLKEIGE